MVNRVYSTSISAKKGDYSYQNIFSEGNYVASEPSSWNLGEGTE